MKNTVLLFILSLVIACGTDFVTSFDEIETYKVRPLAIVFDKSEACPGDTITMTLFTGGQILKEYSCSLATNYYVNNFGKSVYGGLEDSTKFLLDSKLESRKLTLKIRIPDYIFDSSITIPEYPFQRYFDETTPEAFKSISKDSLFELSKELSLNSTPSEDIMTMQSKISQIMATNIVFILSANNQKIERKYSVNVNSLFNNNPLIAKNNNPKIRWIGYYEVKKKNLSYYDPETDTFSYDFHYLWLDSNIKKENNFIVSDTLFYDNDNSYFLAADSGNFNGEDLRDEAISYTGRNSKEVWKYVWFFQNDSSQISNIDHNNGFSFGTQNNNVIGITPPSDEKLNKVNIYLKVYDKLLGILYRSQGSAFLEFPIYIFKK